MLPRLLAEQLPLSAAPCAHLAAGVGRVARAAEHRLQAQEILLALAAGVLEVLQYRDKDRSTMR